MLTMALRSVRLTSCLLVALLILSVAGSFWLARPAQAASTASVRVLHAAPDPAAASVDVFVDGQPLLRGFSFGTLTDYVPLAAGPHTVQVAPAGAGTGQAVITAPVNVQPGAFYTVAAVSQAKGGFDAKVFTDDVSRPANGNARIQVVHLSPDAGPVDVAMTGGQVLISNLAFGNASQVLEVPAGSYNLEVRKAGTNTVALPLPNTQLQAGTDYTVFAIGLAAGSPALTAKIGAFTPTPGMPGTAGGPVAPTSAVASIVQFALAGGILLLLSGFLVGLRLLTVRSARTQKR